MIPFLEPLTPEEEMEYLSRLKTGDKQARSVLVERNLRLVAHLARKYRTSGMEWNELLSIGTLGLIKAIDSFDVSKGRLSTFAARCIENELLMTMRKEKRLQKERSMYEAIGTDGDGNEICLYDVMETQEQRVDVQCERKELAELVMQIMPEVLDKREQQVVIRRFGLLNGREETQNEVAEALHISRSYVSRIEKRALEKLLHAIQ